MIPYAPPAEDWEPKRDGTWVGSGVTAHFVPSEPLLAAEAFAAEEREWATRSGMILRANGGLGLEGEKK